MARHELVTAEDQRRAANAASAMRAERKRAIKQDFDARTAKARNKHERLALKSAGIKQGTPEAARELKRVRANWTSARMNPNGTDGLRFGFSVGGRYEECTRSNCEYIMQAAAAEQATRNARSEATYWRDRVEQRETRTNGSLRGKIVRELALYPRVIDQLPND